MSSIAKGVSSVPSVQTPIPSAAASSTSTMVPSSLVQMLAASNNPQLAQLVDPRGKPQFLAMLSEINIRRGTHLPPELTGIPNASYDPAASLFRTLEVGAEPGFVRIQGQELDLFRLWQVILNNGSSSKVCMKFFIQTGADPRRPDNTIEFLAECSKRRRTTAPPSRRSGSATDCCTHS